MLLQLPDVLSSAEVEAFRARLAGAEWVDGRATAGHQSAQVKRNHQLAVEDPLAVELGERIARALGQMPDFVSAALPKRIYPPMVSRYRAGSGERFGTHVDNAIRYDPRGTMRADLSATLFLSDPESYDGGVLTIEDQFGPRGVKLPAGHMVLYPSSSLHSVAPLTRGERVTAVFWVQSLIRDEVVRRSLFDLDRAIQSIAGEWPDDPRVLALTNVYHNLVRASAEP